MPSSGVSEDVGRDVIDPWGEDEEDEAEHSVSDRTSELQREWEARRVQFHNVGYRDGITSGKNSSVQEGFNLGFGEAVLPGFNWGVCRGASSAYAALPAAVKESLLGDQEARKRLEAWNSTISSISSADAMGMYYSDSVLQTGGTRGGEEEEDSVEGDLQDKGSQVEISPQQQQQQTQAAEEDRTEDEIEPTRDSSHEACGGGGGEGGGGYSDSTASTGIGIGVAPESRAGSGPAVSEDAHRFVAAVSSSARDAEQLENSTTGQLMSMALQGQVPSSSSTSRAVKSSSSRLEQYQANVLTEFEPSLVSLSEFPAS